MSIKATNKQDIEPREVFFLFHQKLVTLFRRKMEDLKFTMPQVETLRFIVQNKNPTMKDVARHFSISAPSATSMVESLEGKKLVVRKMDAKDRRTVRVSVTPKAQKLFSSFKDFKNRMLDEMLGKLNNQDKDALAVLLKKLM